MPRQYVDNAQNRSLGRVGMDHGTAVYSRSSMSSTNSYQGYGGSSSSYSSPAPVYVDNPMNRGLERVGLERGSAPHSSSSASSCSPRTYVDNVQNRALDRVGMQHGTAVHSRSTGSTSASSSVSSVSTPKYVDNAQNQKLGRVGLERGSAPHSSSLVSKSSTTSVQSSAASKAPTHVKAETVTAKRPYVDNAYNRRLGRVGLELGTAVHSTASVSGSKAVVSSAPVKEISEKVYVDNAMNRRHGRVGMPLGSMPISSKNIGNDQMDVLQEILQNLAPVSLETACEDRENGSCDELPDVGPDWNCNNCADMQNAYEQLWQQKQRAEKAGDTTTAIRCNQMEGIVNRYEAAKSSKYNKKQAPAWLKSGDVIEFSDLELGDKLGSGGFGDVHDAIWKGEMRVCVKKLRVQRVSEKKRKDFEQEVKNLSSLKHPAIVTFFGACVTTPNLAIVMEFMKRGSLYDVLHIERHQFTDDAKFSLIADLLSALKFIHGKNFAHRDIKSMNVLICDNMIHCKLGDFGLALKDDAESSSSVADHSVVGTMKYSPIEVLEGERLTLDQFKAVDVYSLAVTVVELMTEKEPFDGMNKNQVRKAVMSGENKDLQEIDHPPLKRLLSASLSKLPRDRPSADQFKIQLDDFVKDYASRA